MVRIKMVTDKEKDKINNLYYNGRKTPNEIATEMFISLETVHKYIGGK